jgi:ubiquinol-cytochrome c reductase subunit 7
VALQLSIQKTVLPKDQWPDIEEDRTKGRYLQPYLEEVRKELAEKDHWGKLA